MIYKADASVINFLLTARLSSNQEELHESSKRSGHYILIDYFDWLDYLNRIDNEDLITKTLYEFRTIHTECKDIIRILQNKLTSDNISNILESNKRVITGNIDKTKIEFLCHGYQLFVEEIQSLQVYLLDIFKYNNSTIPMLLVPFSLGLNRLSSGHINFIESKGDDGMLNVGLEKGEIIDNCRRSKIDFGIRTYTFYKMCDQKPYNIPLAWQISKSFSDKDSPLIKEKTKYIADCYSQYCYTGFVQEDMKFLFSDVGCSTPERFRENTHYSNVFLLNFPFLLPSMQLQPAKVGDKDVNQVLFKKYE